MQFSTQTQQFETTYFAIIIVIYFLWINTIVIKVNANSVDGKSSLCNYTK